MAPDGQTCAISTRRSTSIASGWIHGPSTLAKNTLGAQVTQNRECMHFLASNSSVRFLPSISSTPATVFGAGGAADVAGTAAVDGEAVAAATGFTDEAVARSRPARWERSA